jgi:hypothetical protein
MTDSAVHLRADLRERLVEMRESLIETLAAAPHLDAGLLNLLGSVGAALRAIDASGPEFRRRSQCEL